MSERAVSLRLLRCFSCIAALVAFVACGGRPPISPAGLPDTVRNAITAAPGYGAVQAASAGSAELAAEFETALPVDARPTVHRDAALDCVAGAVAAEYYEVQHVPRQLIQWFHWRCGSTALAGDFKAHRAKGGWTARVLAGDIADFAKSFQGARAGRVYGIASLDLPGGWHTFAIVSGRKNIELAPLKKTFAPGEPLVLEGALAPGYAAPLLYMDDPNGGMHWQFSTATQDDQARFKTTAPTTPGRYFLEVRADEPVAARIDPDRPRSDLLAWLPIYVTVPESGDPDPVFFDPGEPQLPAPAWGDRIVAEINATRAAHGLPALATDPHLSGVAERRSVELARSLTGLLPANVIVQDAVAQAGLPDGEIDDFDRVAAGPLFTKIELMHPSQRLRFTSKKTSLLGVGVTPRPVDEYGNVSFSIAVILLTPAPSFNPAAERSRLLAALDKAQRKGGRSPYVVAPALAAAVQQFADGVCAGTNRADDMATLGQQVVAALGGGAAAFDPPKARKWLGYELDDRATADLGRDLARGNFSHAAVGLCQGTIGRWRKRTYAVVVGLAKLP